MIPYDSVLPAGIFEEPRPVIFEELKGSDFVFAVTRAQKFWPSDRQMEALRPEVLKWCSDNLVHDGDVETPEFSASIYERPGLTAPTGPKASRVPWPWAWPRERFEVPGPPSRPSIPHHETGTLVNSYTPGRGSRAAYSPMTLQGIEMPEASGVFTPARA